MDRSSPHKTFMSAISFADCLKKSVVMLHPVQLTG